MKHKRILSVFIMILFVFGLFSAFSFSVNAAEIISTTNKYTYIRMAPYWTAEVVDELTSGYRITVIERDYSYFYIEYDKGGITKRGYLPLADSNVTGYSWCNHGIFLPGSSNSNTSTTVRYGPNTSYSSCGSITAYEGGDTAPILVLREQDGFYFIQYTTNTSATGSTQPLYKRGWVPKSTIVVDAVSAAPIPNTTSTSQYVLICNSSKQYLTAVADSTQTSGYALKMASATGNNNQQWKIEKLTYNTNSIYYRIVSAAYNVCVTVTDGTALVGNKFILSTPSTSPNKGQEFALTSIYETQIYGNGVNLRTRCSGNYLVAQNSSGTLYQYRKNASLSTQKFYIYPIDNYWNSNYVNGVRNLKYNINSTSLIGNISSTAIENAAAKWNSIANISLTKGTSTNYNIQVRGGNINPNLGLVRPVIDSSGTESTCDANGDSLWYGARLYLNVYNGTTGYLGDCTYNEILLVTAHEFGHTLKIRHPHEGYNSSGYYTESHVNSLMNQGLYTESGAMIPTSASQFDIRSLKNKWG